MTCAEASIEHVRALERAWIRDRALSGELLDDVVRSTYGYALRLGASARLWTRQGESVDVEALFAPYRAALCDLMRDLSDDGWSYPDSPAMHGTGTLAWCGTWHRRTLVERYPEVASLLSRAIRAIYRAYPSYDEFSLQDALRHKRLVLALGGGGGTGYAHLCLFQWLEELGLTPSLITGTSFGALLGYMRALQERYDAAMTMLNLPGLWRITRSMHPCFGTGTHGLMGLCRIDFGSVCEGVLRSTGWIQPPSFSELRIPFACVTTGIVNTAGIGDILAPDRAGLLSGLWRITQLTWHKAIRHAAQVAALISSRESVVPVAFGFDRHSAGMCAIDGVAFSTLVPGVFSYEIPREHYRSRDIVNALFEREHLYRLTDGGLSSNVPVRTARQAVDAGRISTSNAWILGLDVFAPQARDGLFYPLQQIANANALEDARAADVFVRLKYLLSPMELAPSLSRLRWLNARFRKAFQTEMRVLEYAMAPLAPLPALDLWGF